MGDELQVESDAERRSDLHLAEPLDRGLVGRETRARRLGEIRSRDQQARHVGVPPHLSCMQNPEVDADSGERTPTTRATLRCVLPLLLLAAFGATLPSQAGPIYEFRPTMDRVGICVLADSDALVTARLVNVATFLESILLLDFLLVTCRISPRLRTGTVRGADRSRRSSSSPRRIARRRHGRSTLHPGSESR